MIRWVFVFFAWLVSAAILGPLMYFVALLVAGPHSSMLPSQPQSAARLIAWAVFLVGPLIVAASMWRRTALPISMGVPPFEHWRTLSDMERAKIQSTWNTYHGEGRPLVDAVTADFWEQYGHLPGLTLHGPAVYHGGAWVITVQRGAAFDGSALPVLHLGISVHQIVREDPIT